MHQTPTFTSACLIPTYNGERGLQKLIDSVKNQTIDSQIFIADSASIDGTVTIAIENGIEITHIPKSEFNHGGTRQLLVEQYQHYEVLIFLTQDAYLSDSFALEKMLSYFKDPEVGAVCGRQLPHVDANSIAQHARLFNYPEESTVKSLEDVSRFGIKTAFISNSFAAYRTKALNKIGGFPSDVILSEDMYVASKMLLDGWKIVYSGESNCNHSHNYTILEEARRYFDIGVFHAREPWIRKTFGSAEGEGFRFIKSELQFLRSQKKWFLWPEALLRNAIKLTAYKVGQNEHLIPHGLKRRLGMNRSFWLNKGTQANKRSYPPSL